MPQPAGTPFAIQFMAAAVEQRVALERAKPAARSLSAILPMTRIFSTTSG
jgi:hypothetical protein